jgi:hypothetical protein
MTMEDWIFKLQELHAKLEAQGIPAHWYRLHGLFGSSDEDDKVSLEIKRGKFTIEVEIYYKERGVKNSMRTFFDLDEACKYFYDKMIYQQRILHK